MGTLKHLRNRLERHAPAPAPEPLEVVIRRRAIAPDGTPGRCLIRIGNAPPRPVEELSDQELRRVIGAGPEALEGLNDDQLLRLARGEPYGDVVAGPSSTLTLGSP